MMFEISTTLLRVAPGSGSISSLPILSSQVEKLINLTRSVLLTFAFCTLILISSLYVVQCCRRDFSIDA